MCNSILPPLNVLLDCQNFQVLKAIVESQSVNEGPYIAGEKNGTRTKVHYLYSDVSDMIITDTTICVRLEFGANIHFTSDPPSTPQDYPDLHFAFSPSDDFYEISKVMSFDNISSVPIVLEFISGERWEFNRRDVIHRYESEDCIGFRLKTGKHYEIRRITWKDE